MRRLLGFLVVVLVLIVGLAFYRGWFQFSSESGDNKANYTISVDKDKIKADEELAKEKLNELQNKAK